MLRLGPSGARKASPQQYHESVAPMKAQKMLLKQDAE